MDNAEIIRRINSFPSWFYQFDLNGNLTPVSDKRKINRQQQRKKYFFDPLVSLFGGSLAGKRVLDLGCNAGFWSLCAVESGCDFVLGIDGRQIHVDQANFVFEVKEVDRSRYSFIQGNVLDVNFKKFGSFDIVLCLGLMYHVNEPMLLLKRIASVNSDILVIDTNVAPLPGAYLEIRDNDPANPKTALDTLSTRPTRGAIFKMASHYGYSVVMLKPRFSNYRGVFDYRFEHRRVFFCSKKTNLSNPGVDTERVTTFTHFWDFFIWAAEKLPRRWRLFVRGTFN